MDMFTYEESKFHYTFDRPKKKLKNSHHPSTFELIEIHLIFNMFHYGISRIQEPGKDSTRAIHEQLRDCQFPLFESKVIVDEVIELALKYSNRSVFFDDHYVLRLGFKFDMSHRYQKLRRMLVRPWQQLILLTVSNYVKNTFLEDPISS
ncbi:hypothetical protein HAX54_008098 [Datura stramonium]|uniref:Maturase K n=1 Tax=Datura stramonium TaxID=4076 RepID=A0ABS8TE81_DATST|nr:hypothetical protein [Datura stramonium]